jgi:FAD-dependent urate hydroxylase
VLIVGGGIGGLAAARALHEDGHHVVVIEQAPGLRAGGAAVTLWSNGTGILNELKVSLEGVGQQIDVLEQRDYTGKLLLSVDVSRSSSHYGYPHICLPRRRLLERLADGLPPAMIRYGQTCTKVGQSSAAAWVEFADGTRETADLLIGADGRNSVVRNTLWDGDPAELSGWATWQGVTPVPLEITSSHRGAMFVGPPGLCGLMPAGEGLLQWWFDQRWTPESPTPASPVAALQEHFSGFAEPVKEVLAAVKDIDVGFFPHFRHAVPRTWGTGLMTLVGDAAHSMPPTRAQGANQALEDSWALAVALRGGDDGVAEALRRYERARSPKAGIVARQSGKEDTNEYRPWMVKLMPNALVSRYYTLWLRQISNYLT